MATKHLKTIYLNLRADEGTVTGIAVGQFTVENIASGSANVEFSADTSLTDAKAAIIAKLQEDGSTVVDETGE